MFESRFLQLYLFYQKGRVIIHYYVCPLNKKATCQMVEHGYSSNGACFDCLRGHGYKLLLKSQDLVQTDWFLAGFDIQQFKCVN